MARQESRLLLQDKIAVSVGCGGAALLIVTYLIPNKTPGYTVLLLGLLLSFVCYPIAHFGRGWIRIASLAAVSVLVFLFGRSVWPKAAYFSDLRVEDAQPDPLSPGRAVGLNLFIFNDSAQAIRARSFSLANIQGPIGNLEVERRIEDETWRVLEQAVLTRSSVPQYFSPKVRTMTTLTYPEAALSAEQVRAVEEGTGQSSIRFLGVFLSADDSGDHEL